jgi:hypothetical protein
MRLPLAVFNWQQNHICCTSEAISVKMGFGADDTDISDDPDGANADVGSSVGRSHHKNAPHARTHVDRLSFHARRPR